MGDFQQLLPVVKFGNGDACTLMRARWWHSVRLLRLTKNFRSDDPDYCSMLHDVGMGVLPAVTVPLECMASSVGDLVSRVFGTDFDSMLSGESLDEESPHADDDRYSIEQAL